MWVQRLGYLAGRDSSKFHSRRGVVQVRVGSEVKVLAAVRLANQSPHTADSAQVPGTVPRLDEWKSGQAASYLLNESIAQSLLGELLIERKKTHFRVRHL